MEKVIHFSQEEKSLIYNRFVAPANGTGEEALHFVEYCETLGLNPLLGDVVFQKFETKYGPKTSFVTTRDGLLRVAARDENYVGPPISNVVREGDHFEFLPAEGNVVHKFGQKRGRILGAYSILKHKKFDTYAKWVDFSEYFTANASSQQGKSYIWDKYPSAMIEKVAEAFAMKRQFPIVGGLTTEEEIGNDINLSNQMKDVPKENTQPQQQKPEQNNNQTQSEIFKQQTQPVQQTEFEQLQKIEPQQSVNQPVTDVQNQDKQGEELEEVEIERVATGISPSKNIPFGKVNIIKNNGHKVQVLAQDEEVVSLVKDLEQGQKVLMNIEEENGFLFIKGVTTGVN